MTIPCKECGQPYQSAEAASECAAYDRSERASAAEAEVKPWNRFCQTKSPEGWPCSRTPDLHMGRHNFVKPSAPEAEVKS